MHEENYESIFFHSRKSARIPGFNYASHNYYFVTICTHNRKCLFWRSGKLNHLGKSARQYMENIPQFYPQVTVDKFVVMPNHIHAILAIFDPENRNETNLSKVVGQYKMTVSREFHKVHPGEVLWQRSFHDHVIRDQRGYEKIWMYIDGNPLKWEEDCFYCKDPVR